MEQGYKPVRRKNGSNVYITDSGNEIIDIHLNEIEDSIKLEKEIKLIPGIVEVGLFNNIADKVIIGRENTTEIIIR
jgi:ribose 5-phosphate isomerase A